MENKNEEVNVINKESISEKLSQLFKNLPIDFGGQSYTLKYTVGSLLYLEEKGIPIDPIKIQKMYTEKAVYVLAHLLYAGLPLEVKERKSFYAFSDELTTDEVVKMSDYLTKGLKALGHDITPPEIIAKEQEDKSNNEKKN